MSFQIRIEGEVIDLNDEFKTAMQYFSNAEAIQQQNTGQPIDIITMTREDFITIKSACQIVNFNFKEPPKVKTSNLEEVIQPGLAQLFREKTARQLNDLYKAASFLQMDNLCKSICAAIACRIYYPQSLQAYKTKKKQLNIEKEPSAQFSKKLKDQYAFMN